ncbi:SCA7, zinc-binding domain-containing protein [Xylaria palmicola]|nr:SCA7, zinc-binding domain-containing protein [Xylaria palmicola]
MATAAEARRAADDEGTINVASKKATKIRPMAASVKLKRGMPKHTKPGNWRDGSVADGALLPSAILRAAKGYVVKWGHYTDRPTLSVDEKKTKRTASPAAPAAALSPNSVVNQLDEAPRETFMNGRPLEDHLNLQQCKLCKKGVVRTAARAHIDNCLKIKKEKAQRKKEAREARERAKEQAREEEARKADGDGDAKMNDDSDDDDGDGSPEKKANGGKAAAKKVGGKKPDGELKGKKRKADADADKGPKNKKKKEEPKPKVPKPKGNVYTRARIWSRTPSVSWTTFCAFCPERPVLTVRIRNTGPVDVEKQCGVLLVNGQPCARSLTCKSHSMGAKRAVAGRSLPYDMLLAAYQKKNQAKQQKAALDANAPLEEDDDANGGPVDSDEETAAVMGALARWNPQPVLPQPVFTPIRRTYQQARLREQLQTATNGGRTNIFKVVGFGVQKKMADAGAGQDVMDLDAPGEPDVSSMSMMMQGARASSGFGGMPAASRQPSSVSSRA